MGALESWLHYPANILHQGRTSYYIDPSLEGEERDNKVADLEAKDPMIERLKPISDDKPYENQGYTAASNWVIQQCGETIPVNLIGKQEGQTAIYGTVLVKNLSWPGAATVGYKGGFSNIYIGYGHRANQ